VTALALPAPLATRLAGVRWRWLALGGLWAVNGVLLVVTLAAFLYADVGVDWWIYQQAGAMVGSGNLYSWDIHYRYSPLLAYVFAIIPGYAVWTAMHFGALALLPRRLILLALVLFPFWSDIYNGNSVTFCAVAAVLALQGSRWGTVAYFALAVMIPRPIMLPVLIWLLWKRPETRVWFVGAVAVIAAATLATGYAVDWASIVIGKSGTDISSKMDFGPSQLIGGWWMLIGLPLAGWLVWKGRLGWAALAISPYWLPYYGVMLLLPRTYAHQRARKRSPGGDHDPSS
jgi:hypothetical protein